VAGAARSVARTRATPESVAALDAAEAAQALARGQDKAPAAAQPPSLPAARAGSPEGQRPFGLSAAIRTICPQGRHYWSVATGEASEARQGRCPLEEKGKFNK